MLQTENRASAVINVAAAASLAALAAALVSPSIAAGVSSLTRRLLGCGEYALMAVSPNNSA
jgi:hypothetical protein